MKSVIKRFWLNSILVVTGAVLFSAAHPGLFDSRGLSFLGYIALIPVFILTKDNNFKSVWLYGIFYGVISYALFCSWLFTYEKIAFIAVLVIYGLLCGVVFELMHGCFKLFNTKFTLCGYLSSSLVWCAYEYVKTLGFLGMSYGVLGYTQWTDVPVMQIASVCGVWGVSLLCALCSAVIVYTVEKLIAISRAGRGSAFAKTVVAGCLPMAAFILIFCAAVVYGKMTIDAPRGNTKDVKIICVQNDTDPWKTGVDFYNNDIDVLERLTDEALEINPDAQFVVWPESAVVPSIMYNYTMKDDAERLQLVTDVLRYVKSKKAVFVIGNQQSEFTGGRHNKDYNAVLVFDSEAGGIIPPEPEIYRKIHLVPFTEYFPYEKIFPRLYKRLLNGDTHLWDKGARREVFENRGVPFATPICFEDTFGYECAQFKGARLFITVSNDAWSHSAACQNQHASMAVFRCAENRIPAARSTASGLTCIVDCFGGIAVQAEQFKEQAICGEVKIPAQEEKTYYSTHGDWLPVAEMVALLAMSIIGIIGKGVENKRQNEVQ
jgi:apolipoprotein N-acyltransferase